MNQLPVQMQKILKLNLVKIAEDLVQRYPKISSSVLQQALRFFSPFAKKVPLVLTRWEKRVVEAELKVSRSLRDSAGHLHGGAAATAGIELGSFLLLRNVDWPRYTFELKEVDVVFDRPGTGSLLLQTELDPESFEKLNSGLQAKREAVLRLKVNIFAKNKRSTAQEEVIPVACVRMQWHVSLRRWI